MHACSIMFRSLQSHGLQPTRLLCPWNFLGKNTGTGCHFLHQRIFPTQGLNLDLLRLLHWQGDSLSCATREAPPIRMTPFKKARSKYWRGCKEKGTLLHCQWAHKLVRSLQKMAWWALKKLKIELPYDPAI